MMPVSHAYTGCIFLRVEVDNVRTVPIPKVDLSFSPNSGMFIISLAPIDKDGRIE